MKYHIIKVEEKRKLGRKKLSLDGYVLKPKLKEKQTFITVDNLTIQNETLKQNTIIKKFDITYKRLFKIVMNLLESEDTTPSDISIALDEILKMKQILKENYKKELDIRKYHSMERKLNLLEQNIENILFQEKERKENKRGIK